MSEINFCCRCGRKSTAKRIINQFTSRCNDCGPPPQTALTEAAAGANPENMSTTLTEPPQVDDSETLNNVTFGALKAWMTHTNNTYQLVGTCRTKINGKPQ